MYQVRLTAPSGASTTIGSAPIWNIVPKRFDVMNTAAVSHMVSPTFEADEHVYLPNPRSHSLTQMASCYEKGPWHAVLTEHSRTTVGFLLL